MILLKKLNIALKTVLDIGFFKLVFLIGCFLYCMPFTNPFMVGLFKVFILWGVAVFAFQFFCNRKFGIEKADYLIFAFLVLAVIGTFINYRQNLVDNVVAVAYLFVQTVMMLTFDGKGSEKKLRELRAFARVLVWMTFFASILSIAIFLTDFKYSYNDGSQQVVFGSFEGRLWGAQGNPNSLSQFAMVSVWGSVVLLFLNRSNSGNKAEQVFLYVNIVLQLICYVLGNSRSTMLGLCASAAVFAFFLAAMHKKKNGQTVWNAVLKNKLFVIGCVLAVVVSLFAFAFVVKEGMPVLAKPFAGLNMDFLPTYEDDPGTEVPDKEPGVIETDREYMGGDYSNGRFELWSSALKVTAQHPVFGVGIKNVNAHINQYLPADMVQATPKLSENTHNIFFQIMVSHGVIAVAIFGVYLVLFLLKTLRFLFTFQNADEESRNLYCLILTYFVTACGLLVVNLFDSNILYFCAIFLVPVFWTSISNIHYLMKRIPHEQGKKRVLFLADDQEENLVDLVKQLNTENYDITVKTIFGSDGAFKNGVRYECSIKKPTPWKIRMVSVFVKFLPAKVLYSWIVTKPYDVEIAYHEGLSTKILSGSYLESNQIAWIHTDPFAGNLDGRKFRALVKRYGRFRRILCANRDVKNAFDEKTYLYQKTKVWGSTAGEAFDALMNALYFKPEAGQEGLFCTVFTPTYNRAYILGSLYESLLRQTDKDFEWVVVDDGSTDDTESLFQDWCARENGFSIIYLKVPNGGKQKAINRGLEKASGKMFFIVDSDDHLSDDAMETLKKYEASVCGESGFAGVSGMRSYTNDPRAEFSEERPYIDCTNMERADHFLSGDKAEVYYTKLLKEYPFPEVPGERFVTECIVWDAIAFDGYKIRWFRDSIIKGEYLDDGLTKDGLSLFYKNPIGFLLYVRNECAYYPYDLKRKMGNYYRYYLMCAQQKSVRDIAQDLLIRPVTLKGIVAFYKLLKRNA